MKLKDLVRGLAVQGETALDLEISGLAHDSRRAGPGDLFVGWQGVRYDGRDFLAAVAAQGAAAALVAAPAPEDAPLPCLTASDPHALLAPLAARLFDHPDRELLMVGVTGTNGKSTVSTLTADILSEAGHPAGLIGTLGYHFADLKVEGGRTTPEADELFSILRSMRAAGAAAVAMEVSSHSLALGRVAEVSFDVTVFTNLTRDHLDFHHDLENYFLSKRRLFQQLKPRARGVIGVDDPYGRRLWQEWPASVTFSAEHDSLADVRPREVSLDLEGIRGSLVTPRGVLAFESPLLGQYNLKNVLAAVGVGEALRLPQDAIARALAERQPLTGRMQPVERGQDFPVLVDYAHTDAALRAALLSLSQLSPRKIALVFGCGGDRDRGKRPLMGKVAGELADLPILTSDNPRNEDPAEIIAEVEEGLKRSGNRSYRVVPDRREAIRRAISVAGPEWAVLVAGKGHEAVQIVGDEELPFSDAEETARALEEKLGSRTAG